VPARPQLSWCADQGKAGFLARFFADNVGLDYISYGELVGPRALSRDAWHPELATILKDEIASRLVAAGAGTGQSDQPVLVAESQERVLGLALVKVVTAAPTSYAVLEDLVVDRSSRGHGIGRAMMAFIVESMRERGCRRLFLESGSSNQRAHKFFHREGFEPCAVFMMKMLDRS
jgi:ribosomal protein S18 acetylase RimI-like enzyme